MPEPTLPIDTDRLRLRAPEPEDLAPLHAIMSDAGVARWLYWEPRSVEEVSRALDHQINQDRSQELALVAEIRETGELAGHLTLSLGPREHSQAEIGFMFHPDHQGRGYATEASQAVVRLAFETYGLHRLYARLEARNLASARVLEKLGMRREAHLVENEWVKGEWQSEAIYALLAREWRARAAAPEPDEIRSLARQAPTRADLWAAFLRRIAACTVAEIGVYRGEFAAQMLDACPSIETYYMIDPWRHLGDWNKPANRGDDVFAAFFAEAMARTHAHERRRVVLRGRTSEVIDAIPDGTLDFAYVDGDHTLRGITVDLQRVYPKVRDGGWIGGDDFVHSIWQHGAGFEPTLVFPYAVHFAEATGSRIHALGKRQFLIEKRAGGRFEFVDAAGRYGPRELLPQIAAPRDPGGKRLAATVRRFTRLPRRS